MTKEIELKYLGDSEIKTVFHDIPDVNAIREMTIQTFGDGSFSNPKLSYFRFWVRVPEAGLYRVDIGHLPDGDMFKLTYLIHDSNTWEAKNLLIGRKENGFVADGIIY